MDPNEQEGQEMTAAAIKGIGALCHMLNQIGNSDGGGDKTVAKLLCDNELDLRCLVRFALKSAATQA